MNALPTVSVVILARGRQQYLRRSVRSVLGQVGLPFPAQLVVVKDFPDPFVDTLAEEGRAIVLRAEESSGVGENLLRGMEAATGEVVAFLDDDDAFEPSKVLRISEAFAADPKLVYFHTGVQLADDQGRPARGLFHQNTRLDLLVDPSAPATGRALERIVRHSAAINLSSVAVRRLRFLPFTERLRRMEGATDYMFLYTAVETGGRLRFTSELLGTYFIHASAMRPARPDRRAVDNFLRQVEVQTYAHDYGRLVLEPIGARSAADCLLTEWEFVGSVVRGATRRELARSYACFVRRGLPVRPRVVLLAAPIFLASMGSSTLGLRALFVGRQVVRD